MNYYSTIDLNSAAPYLVKVLLEQNKNIAEYVTVKVNRDDKLTLTRCDIIEAMNNNPKQVLSDFLEAQENGYIFEKQPTNFIIDIYNSDIEIITANFHNYYNITYNEEYNIRNPYSEECRPFTINELYRYVSENLIDKNNDEPKEKYDILNFNLSNKFAQFLYDSLIKDTVIGVLQINVVKDEVVIDTIPIAEAGVKDTVYSFALLIDEGLTKEEFIIDIINSDIEIIDTKDSIKYKFLDKTFDSLYELYNEIFYKYDNKIKYIKGSNRYWENYIMDSIKLNMRNIKAIDSSRNIVSKYTILIPSDKLHILESICDYYHIEIDHVTDNESDYKEARYIVDTNLVNRMENEFGIKLEEG